MARNIYFFILPTCILIYGISWALVYLAFSVFRGMTKMFSDDFVLLVAHVFNIKMSSNLTGFTFAFLDGALFGLIIGILILVVFKKNRE